VFTNLENNNIHALSEQNQEDFTYPMDAKIKKHPMFLSKTIKNDLN